MNRRHFLTALSAAVTGAVLDPERLVWIPGQRTIFDLHTPRSGPFTVYLMDGMAFEHHVINLIFTGVSPWERVIPPGLHTVQLVHADWMDHLPLRNFRDARVEIPAPTRPSKRRQFDPPTIHPSTPTRPV